MSAQQEIEAGERFGFGDNWARFLREVDEENITAAVASLKSALGRDLAGLRFLDAGCGSGLFSLAAHRLGAHVVSFDFDESSVRCAEQLRSRFAEADRTWEVLQGSVLDEDFVVGLRGFDVVYSWGVLHHTGDMWRAFDLVDKAVRPGGQLFLAIYNDQGLPSLGWAEVKRRYNAAGPGGRQVMLAAANSYFGLRRVAKRLFEPAGAATARPRGMVVGTDLVDWVGGYPFEVAKPEQVFAFYRDRGYDLQHLKTCRGGHGCNEYVLGKEA